MESRVQKCGNRHKEAASGCPSSRISSDKVPFALTTDALLTGNGAILNQKQGTEDGVIAYTSKTLSKIKRII